MTIFEKAMINDIEYFKNNTYDINIQNKDGKSLLHYAVLGSAFEVIKELIKRGININILDNNNESAIFDCARKAKIEIAKILIINNINLNQKNKQGESLIHLASYKGDIDFINLLVENDIKINTTTNEGLYPVHYAVISSNINIIKPLLNISNQSFLLKDKNNNSLLHYATKTTNDLLIYFLISEGININLMNNDFETPLFNAARFGTRETVLALLNNDAYIDIKNNKRETPHDLALAYDNLKVETLLNNYQMLPKYERLIKKESLIIATLNRSYNLLEHLINNKTPLTHDKFNYTALDYAKMYNLKEAIKIINKNSY